MARELMNRIDPTLYNMKAPMRKDTCKVLITIKINDIEIKLTKKEALLVLVELEKLNLKNNEWKHGKDIL